MVIALPLSLVAAAQAVPSQLPDVAAMTATAGVMCVVSASKKGADQSRFASDPTWVRSPDGKSFRHRSMPIEVTFPEDSDGIARNCEVHATLPSQTIQAGLKAGLATSLKSKPFEQSDSTIWMFDTKNGPRGLQFFPDKTSDQPKVRLIGAAF
jgi:hypothetical protein